MAWTELAAMLVANAMIVLLIALLGTLGIVTGEWIVPAIGASLTIFVTRPFRPSRTEMRDLAAGRWP